mgnify:CR=1 FL=1
MIELKNIIKTYQMGDSTVHALDGIDLKIELPDNDNPSDKVNAFLFRVENRIARRIRKS